MMMLIQNLKKNAFMPMPSNINYWWNFGSLLGICLVLQILTGFFLTMYYENSSNMAFESINQINRNINMGWAIQLFHANGASFFFILIYMHLGRGLFFKSFNNKLTWLSGIIILLLLFMTAFLGYVLPWGQMSYWGATVITNLISSLPYIGDTITIWLWGGYSVNKATLLRFFSLHFIMPLLILLFVMIHIMFLHNFGSNNPLGLNSNLDKIPFIPFFLWKDLISFFFFFLILFMVCMLFPTLFMDPDNFIPANPLSTPPHIQPEWYFLFAYAILRTIPNKLGGVLALLFSILILIIPTFNNMNFSSNFTMKIIFKFFFYTFFMNFIYLTFMGAQSIEPPFEIISKILSLIYFYFFLFYI